METAYAPSKKLLEVVWEVGAASIAGVHRYEDSHVRVDLDILTNQLHRDCLCIGTS